MQVQYLGCGGLYIHQPGRAIMIDPYFSHQSFLRIGKSMFVNGKIRSKPRQLSYGKKMIQDSLLLSEESLRGDTKAIFSAHGHYDHLMDVPYIFKHWLEKRADVYANTSSVNTCTNVISNEKLHDLEPILAIRNEEGQSIDIVGEDGSVMKVYPILADHNPHAKNIKLFTGTVMKPLTNFKDPKDKTRVNDWLEGRTLSFLIDIEQDNNIVFRMFVQSSTCRYPDGLPPKTLLAEKSIDLAIMGIASYQFSESSYPCAFLEQLQPKELMFIHWEDFFRNYKRKPKSVINNDIPRFFRRLNEQCKPPHYILPVPGSVITVEY